ncbi:MAG: cation acetate symporter [Pseudonocardiaceae bacterium]|nr:cation acetate symporter [Pseudonocardiaceae bacterium]
MNPWALGGVLLVAIVTFYIGHRSSRLASTTQDFLVARRTVRSRRNAAAVSGEYLSAASFLGVAGLVLKDGADALWFPIGFTAGYLALMLFVAAPLRRSGAYTLPDFAEARLASVGLRRLATCCVLLIGTLYLMPQLQGASLALSTIVPAPSWVGAVLVSAVVIVNVIGGGMRAITVVQAFQYWLKLFAIAVPAFVLCAVFVGGGAAEQTSGDSLSQPTSPTFAKETTVDVRTPVTLDFSQPMWVRVDGSVDNHPRGAKPTYLSSGEHTVSEGTKIRFNEGASVPVVAGSPVYNSQWLRAGDDGINSVFVTYSLILATFLGTMGLPHVLVRFYTNPSGRAARRTTLHVLLLLGLFYLFPILIGALSRLYTPELLVTGETDAAVLLLPNAMLPGALGQVLGAVTAAGAFAAFLSTSSGLLVSLSGVLSTDVFRGRVRDFRLATVVAGIVPLLLAVSVRPQDISLSVGMTFALAASTFSPVLVLGIWWRKLTDLGAAVGMVLGGGLVLASLVLDRVSSYTGNWAPQLVEQPALVTVPVAFLATVLVSKATAGRVPSDVNRILLRMHAPDPLGFIRDRDVARFGRAEEKLRLSGGRHRK